MKQIPRRLYGALALALGAIIFVALNIAVDSTITSARIDLTENGLYTLSQGTKNTVAKLDEPITLKLYYSAKVAADYAQIQAYATRVRDLLNEYAARSGGKITLTEIDPESFTPEEDEATAAGLTGIPTDSGEMVYFGLVGTNTIGGREVIPYFSQNRESYLEYDVTSLIYHLANPKKPLIGIISSLPLESGAGGMAAMLQGQSQPYAIYQELSAAYQTKMLEQNFTSIPKDVDVLLIAHPTGLNDQQLYAIDQFVLKGGRALVFVDPNAEIAQAQAGMDPRAAGAAMSDLPRLFKAWGIDYNPQKIVADVALAQRVQTPDPRNPVAAYPAWLRLGPDQFDHNDQITANLQSLNLASSGFLKPARGATTKFTPLIISSDQAAALDSVMVRMTQNPQDLIKLVEPTGEQFVLAARISGTAKTAFPGGAPVPGGPAEVMQSAHGINVVVMADADIFDDRFWVRMENVFGKRVASPFADNGAFVLNALENLTGSGDLISLRTRATSNRPFTVVQELQANAQAKFQQEAEALQQRINDAQTRLRSLEQGEESGKTLTLTAEQQAEIERFQTELIQSRTALRDVQRKLREDVDELGAWLAFFNIAAVPLLVAAFAIGLAILRRRRRARTARV
ncbi:MAG: ABC transporter [Alphaproteobacteria bacterium]|nr:ABC transporter [Alphaproteobacteria bacterium]